jgi:hypothetical protein
MCLKGFYHLSGFSLSCVCIVGSFQLPLIVAGSLLVCVLLMVVFTTMCWRVVPVVSSFWGRGTGVGRPV